MRSNSVLLSFILLLLPATSAMADPTADYLAARDRYIAEFKNLTGGDRNDKRAVRALAEVDRLLRVAVPAWKASGFPSTGEINLSCVDDNEMGFSVPDGLTYRAGDTSVIVTNRMLLMRWLTAHNSSDRTQVPVSIPAAFRDETFWTFAVGCDAGAEIPYSMPMKPPAGADSVTVALAEFTQDLQFDRPPDHIFVAVVRGDRVWLADQRLKQKLAPFAACKGAFKRESNEFPFAPTVQESARKHDEAFERAEQNYLTCFARHLRQRPDYTAVQEQAQLLVDLLH